MSETIPRAQVRHLQELGDRRFGYFARWAAENGARSETTERPGGNVHFWSTKDSGERATFSTGMVRDTTTGKPRFDLLVPLGLPYAYQPLTREAALMARGAEKYSPRNWEFAETEEELERFKESAFRHFMQWLSGETDEDHYAAVVFNLRGAEYVKYRLAQKSLSQKKRKKRKKKGNIEDDD